MDTPQDALDAADTSRASACAKSWDGNTSGEHARVSGQGPWDWESGRIEKVEPGAGEDGPQDLVVGRVCERGRWEWRDAAIAAASARVGVCEQGRCVSS